MPRRSCLQVVANKIPPKAVPSPPVPVARSIPLPSQGNRSEGETNRTVGTPVLQKIVRLDLVYQFLMTDGAVHI